MIDTLIGALKLSLAECNSVRGSTEYIRAINEVLNRYKTNLYKLIPDKSLHLYDSKEFIQLRLCFSWKIKNNTREMIIKEHSPVLLHVSGFVPELGLRKNREKGFIKAVDVSDVVDLEKVAGTNFASHLDTDDNDDEPQEGMTLRQELGQGVYFTHDKSADGQSSICVQISGQVYQSVQSDHRAQVTDNERRRVPMGERVKEEIANRKKSSEWSRRKIPQPTPRFYV